MMRIRTASATKYERVSEHASPPSDWDDYFGPHSTPYAASAPAPYLRRRRPLVRVFASLSATALALALCGLVWWLNSSLRSDLIAVQYTVCATPPWYLFTRRAAGVELYTPAELAHPGRRRGTSEGAASRVGMLQVCNVPVKRWSLDILLRNHRQYAEKWDLPWRVESGIRRGTWSKIVALREWMSRELEVGEGGRLEWLFMSDVDTIMANPSTDISALLPPSGKGADASFLISKDHNGLNAGIFFVRVSSASLAFLDEILSHEHDFPPLHFAEQAALSLLIKKYSMESTGAVVYYPQEWINSYDSGVALTEVNRAFVVHWPARDFKRYSMLPWLRDVRDGKVPDQKEESVAQSSRDVLLKEVDEFWASRD